MAGSCSACSSRWLPIVGIVALIGAGVAYFAWPTKDVQPNRSAKQPAVLVKDGVAAFQTTDDLVVTVQMEKKQDDPVQGDLDVSVVDAKGFTIGAKKQIEQREQLAVHRVPLSVPKGSIEELKLKIAFGDQKRELKLSDVLLARAHEAAVTTSKEFHAGSMAALRCEVRGVKSISETIPLKNAVVKARLIAPDGTPHALYDGKVGEDGISNVQMQIPDVVAGPYKLEVETRSHLGQETLRQDVQIKSLPKILLVTDKPIYKPGQLIHVRALSLSAFHLKPVKGKQVVFEIEDSKGNKVFKRERATNDYGIANVDFQLASEVNEGDYRIRAIVGKHQSEKTVAVKPYVLPKFRTELKTNKKFYLPGETLEGDLQVSYFFGKPVAGGDVQVTASTLDVGQGEFAKWSGKTNEDGHVKFEIKLLKAFAGIPLAKGNALIRLDVKVTDTAGQKVDFVKTLPVSKSPIQLSLIPEAGKLVPGVENRIFVAAIYPDGSPAQADVQVFLNRQAQGDPAVKLKTNEAGLAEFAFTPDEKQFRTNGWVNHKVEMLGGNVQQVGMPKKVFDLAVSARDKTGAIAKKIVELTSEPFGDNVLLRLDKAIYNGGDKMKVDVLTTAGMPTAYVDVIRDGQTILTKWLNVKDGKATQLLDLPASIFGTLEIHAYQMMASGEIVRDARVAYVQPASNLNVKVTAGKETYRPGEEGIIRFEVTDSGGNPAQAALGVIVVDEAVYALQEMQPGLEKVYFTLQKELLKPRAQVIYQPRESLPELIKQPVLPAGKQQIAQVLLTAIEPKPAKQWQVDAATERQRELDYQLYALGNMLIHYPWNQGHTYRDPNDKNRFKSGLLEVVLKHNRLYKPTLLIDPLGNKLTIEGLAKLKKDFTPNRLALAIKDRRIQGIQLFEPKRKVSQAFLMTAHQFLAKHQVPRPRNRFNLERADFAGGDRAVAAQADAGGAAPPFAPGAGGGGRGGAVLEGAPADAAKLGADPQAAPDEDGGAKPARVRNFFPETMLWQPTLITDASGKAQLDVAFADSITTWRLTASASSKGGLLGGTTSPLRVFQPFFVDMDLPVNLTQSDEVTFPVAVYNYLKTPQTVTVTLDKRPWFDLVQGDARQSLVLKPNEVRSVKYRIRAKKIGVSQLKVDASSPMLADAVERSIEVVPDGQKVEQVATDRLSGEITEMITIPEDAIADASNLRVKIYPGVFSQVLEGAEGMLRMPSGCFEQTSSSAYPNILIIDYLKKTNKQSPKLLMRAESLLNVGYQKLLTFERPGGGFDWWGSGPPLEWLSAYGLQEFSDMAKVYPIDDGIIKRTQAYLMKQRAADGTWSKIGQTHGVSIESMGDPKMLLTSYVTWSLLDSGMGKDPRLEKSIAFIRDNVNDVKNAYVLALAANALASWNADDDSSRDALKRLNAMRKEMPEIKACCFPVEKGQSLYYARGDALTVETTAMAVLAMLKTKEYHNQINQGLTYLIKQKGPHGTWGSTQATILALKALVRGAGGQPQKGTAKFTILVNGKEAASGEISEKNSDVMQTFDLKQHVTVGANEVKIKVEGETNVMYQVVGRHFKPWDDKPVKDPVLAIDVKYDRTELATNDVIKATASLKFNGDQSTYQVIVDLGIPPGFSVDPGDLAEWVGSKKIERFSLTSRQVTLYLGKLEPGYTGSFEYHLKAQFPIKAKTPVTLVYEYYTPKNRAEAKPVQLTVVEKK